MKHNAEAPLRDCKGLGLPSLKRPWNLTRNKKLRRRPFRQKQKKKATKQIQNLEIFNMYKTSGDRINTNPCQGQLVKTSYGPWICEKAIRIPKVPVPDKAENKPVEKQIQIQMPSTNMPKSNPPTQLFMNQQYKTAQIGGNIVRNCVFDSAQTNPLSPQGTFPVMYNPQR